MSADKKLSFKKAAYQVLVEADQPLHCSEITERALSQNLVLTKGETPAATMGSQLAVDLLKRGEASRFVRVAPGTFGLREWLSRGDLQVLEATASRVKIPHYPQYQQVRKLLPVLHGVTRGLVTSLQSAIFAHRGTPQQNEDWSSPETWINERLEGEHLDIAHRIWEETSHLLNPRHLRGSWLLATGYDLLSDENCETLQVTERGRNFIDEPTGEVVQEIDEAEGVLKLLALIVELGPAARGDLADPYKEYLHEVSNVRADSTIKSFLWARLRNLKERDLVTHSGQSYKITDAGLAYLDGADFEDSTSAESDDQKLRRLIGEHAQKFRDTLTVTLHCMDPYAFEHLIRNLLEAMGYEDVEVTSPSGDGGVDVIGRIQLGITEVREVVQVKRHAKNIQRHVLDALRGSLHRFHAVRGTIITTSDFARGTRDAAFEHGAAPITLINGEKLIDLLIEHRIGIRKRSLELLEIEPSAFKADGPISVEA